MAMIKDFIYTVYEFHDKFSNCKKKSTPPPPHCVTGLQASWSQKTKKAIVDLQSVWRLYLSTKN